MTKSPTKGNPITSSSNPNHLLYTPEPGWFECLSTFYLLLGEWRSKFVLTFVILAGIFAFDLVPPYVVGVIVDRLADGLPVTGQILFLSAAWGVVSVVRLSAKRVMASIGIEVRHRSKVLGFERLMEQSLEWHDQDSSGAKVIRLENGSRSLQDGSHLVCNEILPLVSVAVSVMSYFLFQSFQLLVCIIAYLSLFFAVQIFFFRRIVRANSELNVLRERSGGVFFEGASNVRTVKSLGASKAVVSRICDSEERTLGQALHVKNLHIYKWKTFQIVNAAFLGIFLFLLVNLFQDSKITIGVFFPAYVYFQRLMESSGNFSNLFDSLIEIKTTIARMIAVINLSSPQNAFSKVTLPSRWEALRLDQVSFCYPSTQDRTSSGVTNVSFVVPRKARIGIVGTSGSGKSTIASLILGLYEPQAGTIEIDGIDLITLDPFERSRIVSIVPQESELFNISLRDNVTLYKAVDLTLLNRAIQIAQLEDLINSMPNGLDTEIGEKGYRLSGGERQRIAIARAIVQNPQILILDEATSALNIEMEQRVMTALYRELPEVTLIVIAHRVSTIQSAETILVVENGHIIEQGSYSELRSEYNLFNKLYPTEHSE